MKRKSNEEILTTVTDILEKLHDRITDLEERMSKVDDRIEGLKDRMSRSEEWRKNGQWLNQ